MTLVDKGQVLAEGLAAIRRQYAVPESFPADVLAAAEDAAKRVPTGHADRTGRSFVTLDPASSTDLDQAFDIERSGSDLLLFYAIADVPFFVRDGDPVDREAWRRGVTLYLPNGRAGLHPAILSEGAASLLPEVDRPAIVLAIRVAPDGGTKLDGVERALIRSRAKLAYAGVRDDQLPADFAELARRVSDTENRRGASRLDPPEQEVVERDGAFELSFRPRLVSEDRNAYLSLAANLAVADTLLQHHTGLFRVMAEPDEAATARLRRAARALGIAWPDEVSLPAFRCGLDAADPRQAAMMLAIRRAGSRASYMPYRDGVVPWHAAMAATYCHATAPLRRLADRYVLLAILAIANGEAVPEAVSQAFERLPEVMSRADSRQGQIDRAVVDLAEAAILAGRAGEEFAAIVLDLDERGLRIQLRDLPVVALVPGSGQVPGDIVTVRLVSADPGTRKVVFGLVRQTP